MKTFIFILIIADLLATSSAYTGFYADNGIDQTILYKTASKKEKKAMQQEILNVLGLHHRPKPTTHEMEASAPKYMIDLYQSFVDEDGGNLKLDTLRLHEMNLTRNSVETLNDADIIMSFLNHGHHLTHIRHDKDRRFWFDLSEVPPEETIMGAELRLYKQPVTNMKRENTDQTAVYNITVYELIEGMELEEKLLNYLDSTVIKISEDGWIKLNVTRASSDWVVFPDKNLGLLIRIHQQGHLREIHPKEIGIVGAKGEATRRPFMIAFFKSPKDLHIRKARAAKRNQRAGQSSLNDPLSGLDINNYAYARYAKRSCHKRTLYVSFKELRWQDWIIAPDGYPAFYCHGECSFPLNSHMNATNHAIVQTLVHLLYPDKVPKPCCSATKLTAISVLYFDDSSNVILQKYRNMVVKTCGCH